VHKGNYIAFPLTSTYKDNKNNCHISHGCLHILFRILHLFWFSFGILVTDFRQRARSPRPRGGHMGPYEGLEKAVDRHYYALIIQLQLLRST